MNTYLNYWKKILIYDDYELIIKLIVIESIPNRETTENSRNFLTTCIYTKKNQNLKLENS